MLKGNPEAIQRSSSLITANTCILRKKAWPMKCLGRKGDASRIGTNESIACPQKIDWYKVYGPDIKACIIHYSG
jgi:hypothetical protein